MVNYRGFIGPTYMVSSYMADQELTINLYYEKVQSNNAPFSASLLQIPGVQKIGQGSLGIGSAHIWVPGPDREFAIIGNSFVEIDISGNVTTYGTVSLNGTPGTISYNGKSGGQLFITSGGNGYLFTLATNAFASIAALAGKAAQGNFIDGYFISLDLTLNRIYISNLNDGATWDPNQWFSRSIASDPWIAMAVVNRLIYLFGSQTSEVWYDAGTSPIPFQAHPSGLIQFGTPASASPKVVAGTVVFLASTLNGSGDVMQMQGFTPVSVGNYSTQYAFSNFTSFTDAIGDCIDYKGHTFYTLYFPSQNASFMWDAELQVWTQIGTWITETGQYVAWRPAFHAFAFQQNRCLDRAGSGIYNLTSDSYVDVESRPIRRVRRAPGLVKEDERLVYNQFILGIDTGDALQNWQGSNPMVSLRYSDDGGRTWSVEDWRSLGYIGEYGTVVIWNRLGASRRRVFEVCITDPVPSRFVSAYLKMGKGRDQLG